MDVSSRYFAKLRQPSLYWFVYVWRFFVAIHRVGKLRELISFAGWEIAHRIRLYRLGKQYVTFDANPYISVTDAGFLPLDAVNENPFLTESGVWFQPAAIDWQYCMTMTDGSTWGSCFANPKALYVSHDPGQLAEVIHEFSRPITSLLYQSAGCPVCLLRRANSPKR